MFTEQVTIQGMLSSQNKSSICSIHKVPPHLKY